MSFAKRTILYKVGIAGWAQCLLEVVPDQAHSDFERMRTLRDVHSVQGYQHGAAPFFIFVLIMCRLCLWLAPVSCLRSSLEKRQAGR